MKRLSILHLFALGLVSGNASLSHAQQDTTTQYQYDAQGNLTQITDPLGRVTNHSYDALNRLTQQLQPAPSAGATRPVIGYRYDGLDQLIAVTDPRNLVTAYTVDGLGNQTQLASPDTGTSSRTHDAAGNVLTSTDAKGQVTRYTYDVLSRVTRITYADGQAIDYGYDAGTNGIGRLSHLTDAAGSTQYAYDAKGRLASETRTIGGRAYTTGYHYDSVGRFTGITYPSGTLLSYRHDAAGRISQVDVTKDGATHTLVQQVRYQPFGGIQSFVNGAGQSISRTIDLDGRITGYTLRGQPQVLSYDAASRIRTLWDTQSVNSVHNYTYDNLDRLTQYAGPIGTQTLGYDASGNRTSQLRGSSLTQIGIDPASNRITQVAGDTVNAYQHDANGSLLHNGGNAFGYDARGRMTSAQTVLGPVQYQVNALGQRIRKNSPGQGIVYHYDAGGRLIAESSDQGAFRKEYVYLGTLPVAVLAK